MMNGDKTLAESAFGNGTFVLTIGGRLMVEKIEHAGFLTKGRTDAPRKFREGVGGRKQLISQFPVAFVKGLIPFRGLIAKRTSPMAERNSAIHTARSLLATVVGIERLLHFAEIMNAVVYRTITRFFPVYL